MAEELSISAHVALYDAVTKIKVVSPTAVVQQTPGTLIGSSFTVIVGTSEETVDFGDISPGLILIENLDATNFVSWSTVSGDYDKKLLAGNDRALFRFVNSSQALYLKADTATCNVLVTAINE